MLESKIVSPLHWDERIRENLEGDSHRESFWAHCIIYYWSDDFRVTLSDTSQTSISVHLRQALLSAGVWGQEAAYRKAASGSHSHQCRQDLPEHHEISLLCICFVCFLGILKMSGKKKSMGKLRSGESEWPSRSRKAWRREPIDKSSPVPPMPSPRVWLGYLRLHSIRGMEAGH